MTPTSPKIIFFGTEDYSLGTLKVLVENGFSVAAAVTKPDAPRGRGHKLAAPPVKTFALKHNIPVWQPTKLRDIADDIRALQPVAGVLVAYGKIIPQPIIDLFTPGIINLHPSLLPLYRGPSPIEAAIANRDAETGVTIMQLEAGMDSGPVYCQQTVALSGDETRPELYQTLFSLGEQMLTETLPNILTGKLHPTPQDDSQATYCSLLSKEDSLLDPAAITAPIAEAHVRAHLGFPRTRLSIGDTPLIITQAHIDHTKTSPLSVRCKDGLYLTVDELIAPSGKTMSAESFVRGYGHVL
jgi:methionyl-tRNA formyltransferase